MQKNIIISILLWIILLPCYSQKNLKEGYIINLHNDTIIGYIDFRGDIYNSMKCVFYSKPGTKKIVYNPGDIIAYRLTDSRFYISKTVSTGGNEEVIFLEYLFNGITNLYYFRNKTGDHYFIEKGDEIYELTNNSSIISTESGRYLAKSNKYIGILDIIYSDAKEIYPLIENTKFDKESMVKLSQEYHSMVCPDRKCIVYEKDIKELKFDIGLVVSTNLENNKFKDLFAPLDYRSSLIVLAGIAINLRLLSVTQKLNINIKGLMGEVHSTGISEEYTSTGYNTTNLHFTREEMKINPNICYEFFFGKVRPYCGIGCNYDFSFNQKSEYSKLYYDIEGVQIDQKFINDIIKHRYSFSFSLVSGISFILKKSNILFTEISYSVGKGFYNEYGIPKLSSLPNTIFSEKSRFSTIGISTGILF